MPRFAGEEDEAVQYGPGLEVFFQPFLHPGERGWPPFPSKAEKISSTRISGENMAGTAGMPALAQRPSQTDRWVVFCKSFSRGC